MNGISFFSQNKHETGSWTYHVIEFLFFTGGELNSRIIECFHIFMSIKLREKWDCSNKTRGQNYNNNKIEGASSRKSLHTLHFILVGIFPLKEVPRP